MSDELSLAREAHREAIHKQSAIEDEARRAGNEARDAVLLDLGHKASIDAVNAAAEKIREIENSAPDHEWTGKRVFRMKNVGYGYRPVFERTEGVVETRRLETTFPANSANYSLPSLGEGFVRLLNKSGKPGSRFETLGRIHSWKLV